jgi:hypothetical protein
MRTLFATLLLVIGLAAFATPSTLITIPSTDIQAAGTWHLGMDTFVYTNGSTAVNFADLGLTYGVTPRIELGIDLVSPQNNPLWLNGKIQLVTPDQFPVAVAAGIYNYSTTDAVNQEVMYVVGSGTIPGLPARITGGLWQGNDVAIGADDSGFMLGVDKTIDKWWFGADYISGDSLLGSLNVGVGYALTDKIGIIVGYDKFNASGAADAVNFQLDVNF